MLDFFNEISLHMVVFFAVFSMGLAIFHTVILKVLFRLQFKTWLFFVLNPALIMGAYFISNSLSGIVFVVLAGSVFLLAFIGMIYQMIVGTIQDIKERNEGKNKPTHWWQILLALMGGATIFASFIYLGVVTIIVLIIIFIIVSKILPNSENRFFRLQGILPTAPIRSIPMGLIEVTGKVRYLEPLAAPIKNRRCAGYRYVVEQVKNNSDGKREYSTVIDEKKCNSFLLSDETGDVKVDGNELDMFYLKLDEQYSSGSRRYSQYLLKEGDEVLLIGKAENFGNGNMITRDEFKKVFALAPLSTVTKYNVNKPLFRSLATMAVVLACLIAFVLLADVSISEKVIVVSWKNSLNLF